MSFRIITGTGRCGTHYTQRLLTNAGLRAWHETIWNLGGHKTKGKNGVFPDVEVSMYAAAHLPLDQPVAHQVRHPLRVIESWYARGIFAKNKKLRQRVEGAIGPLPEDRFQAACLFWVRWTEHIDRHAHLWWRVEDLSMEVLAGFTGADVAKLEQAAQEIPTNEHARKPGQADYRLDPDEIPRDIWDLIVERGERYGYEVER